MSLRACRCCFRFRLVALVLGATLLGGEGASRPAKACDACLEDKIAATYDWQVVTAARRRGHTVVLTALRGSIRPNDEALARRIARIVSSVAGVDAGTVRVALAPPAISFACDSTRRPPRAEIAAINRRLRPSGIALVLVRIGAPAGAG